MFRLNIVNDNIASAFMSTSKLNNLILWHARLGHVHFKRMQDMSKDRTESMVLGDAIFDENRLSSVSRPSLSIPKGTKDIGGSVVPEMVTKEVVQQPEPKLRKSKRNKTPKDFGPEFQLYLIKGIRDEVDGTIEKFKARLVIQGFRQRFSMKDMGEVDVILGIRIKHESNGIAISQSHYIEEVLKKFNYFECTPISTPMDTNEKLSHPQMGPGRKTCPKVFSIWKAFGEKYSELLSFIWRRKKNNGHDYGPTPTSHQEFLSDSCEKA
ncbi:zinc finger, CCHC-type containing protein [Tanacetum coccineum]